MNELPFSSPPEFNTATLNTSAHSLLFPIHLSSSSGHSHCTPIDININQYQPTSHHLPAHTLKSFTEQYANRESYLVLTGESEDTLYTSLIPSTKPYLLFRLFVYLNSVNSYLLVRENQLMKLVATVLRDRNLFHLSITYSRYQKSNEPQCAKISKPEKQSFLPFSGVWGSP